MRVVLEAVRDALGALGAPAGVGDMSGTRPPFVSVWGPPRGREQDRGHGTAGQFSAVIGFTATAQTEAVAVELADDVLELLTPGLRPHSIHLPSGVLTLAFMSAQNVQTDRQVSLPESDTHPAYVTAQLRAHWQPKE